VMRSRCHSRNEQKAVFMLSPRPWSVNQQVVFVVSKKKKESSICCLPVPDVHAMTCNVVMFFVDNSEWINMVNVRLMFWSFVNQVLIVQCFAYIAILKPHQYACKAILKPRLSHMENEWANTIQNG
jgi:hypothetical protein